MNQRNLFTPDAYGNVIPTPTQARDAALASVEQHAEADCPGFMERAKAFVLTHLERGPASGEDITDAGLKAGIVPSEKRAWGAVYRVLSLAKLIRVVGDCKRRKGHSSSGGNIWALKQEKDHE